MSHRSTRWWRCMSPVIMLVANSMALASVGIDASTPDPEGGVIGRIPGSREPNGLLEETARLDIMRQMQDLGLVDTYRLMKAAANEYAAVGVTTAQSGRSQQEIGDRLILFSRLGVIPQRLILFPFETEFGEDLLNGEYDPADYQWRQGGDGCRQAGGRWQHPGLYRLSQCALSLALSRR